MLKIEYLWIVVQLPISVHPGHNNNHLYIRHSQESDISLSSAFITRVASKYFPSVCALMAQSSLSSWYTEKRFRVWAAELNSN